MLASEPTLWGLSRKTNGGIGSVHHISVLDSRCCIWNPQINTRISQHDPATSKVILTGYRPAEANLEHLQLHHPETASSGLFPESTEHGEMGTQ